MSTKNLKYLELRAARGDGLAQLELGKRYYEGEGVPKRHKTAASLFSKSAKKGVAEAQFHLGKLYYEGKGVLRHYETAARLFLDSANKGVVEAQFALGKMYCEDKVAQERDYEKAKYWLNEAANEHGLADAQLYLGKVLDGQKNCIEAYKWFCLAAVQGNKVARKRLGKLEKKMLKSSPEDVFRAQNDAGSWWRAHQKSVAQ